MADILEMAQAIANDGPWTREAVEVRAAHIIGSALAQERERCAIVAMTWARNEYEYKIADAIRAEPVSLEQGAKP